MEEDNCVAVTHFINPHLFWYKTIGAPDRKFQELRTIENILLESYKNKPLCDFLRPQIGDKVAVNFIAWNKFIRAEVLQKAEFQQEHYTVWAIDYGFPLLTKKEYIRNLPINLQVDIGHVETGGIINVIPAEQEFDDMEGNLVMVRKDMWLQRACDMLEKLIADANSISFNKRYQTENGHVWGDLIIVNHKGIEINARDYLLKAINAVEEDEFVFKDTCSKFKTTKIAKWLTNDRKTKMKINNIKHNYIEHSKQMNANMIDENAKRKVEDWQERNERNKIENPTEVTEINFEISDDNIDDVTFDDSVSVTHSHPENYIGKAGILTKIKQQKYPSKNDLPPSALPKSFEIGDVLVDLNSLTEPQQQSYFAHSPEKRSEFRITQDLVQGNEKKFVPSDFLNIHNQTGSAIDLESTSSSKISCATREQKLFEMRKKLARAERENKINKKPMGNQNETINSTLSLSKTSESYPYKLLDQSSTLSSLNNTTIDKTQGNNSEISVKNIRVQHLLAMRKKFGSSSIASSKSSNVVNTTGEYQLSTNNNHIKADEKDKHGMDSINFQLKSKTISKAENKVEHLHPISSASSSSKNTVKESIKLTRSGYDSLTMVPAGYDITRLQTYNDEKNHWHRKKSTRNDYVPHEQTSSTEEILSNNTNDESFSFSNPFKESSESSKNQYKRISNKSSNNSNFEQDSQLKRCFQEDLTKEFKEKTISANNLSSELSTSSNSHVCSQRLRKRRQLKSPTSQLLKIDKILEKHDIEKASGNTNILDLKLLNTSNNSQKSLLTSTSSNNSCNNKNILSIDENSNINNVSSQSSSSIENIRSMKVQDEVVNYDALIDVKHTDYLPIVEGERKIQTKFIDHLVLAHSSIQLTPIENIAEAPFLPEIHQEMRQMRVNKVYRIQVYSWSHVLRNNSLFVVNPSRSGKTWSYLPALCSLLCCRKDIIPSSYGPVAIILVASLKHVELVTNYCRRLMSGFKAEAPKCVPSYGMRNLIETKVNLLDGCGILIATPSNVLRLLRENENEPLFNAERLQHIVIDDMDIMMSRSQQDFENACSTLFKMAKKSNFKKLSPQLIVISRDWDGLMVKFIRKSNQPLLLMGDFLEAAVYGHASLSVKLKSSEKKNEAILKFIKETSDQAQGGDNRTLILCNDDEDVLNVHKFLQDCGYPCMIYYTRSTGSECVDEWKRKVSSQILVCTDARFCELKVQNVNNLIHYSMPTSWTQFTLRFSAFARTYNNYVCCFEHNILSTTSTTTKTYSLILLDENNNLQLPRLVDFMRKHNQKVRKEILAVSKQVLITREEQRILKTSLLCPQLLEFGECDEARCDSRHELTSIDVIKKSDGIPCNGEIRIHVLKVFSPTHYAVRLLHHKTADTKKWTETRRSNEALTFSMQLNMHYYNDKNLFLHWPPHVNDLCIYQYANNFRRARVLEAPIFQEVGTNVVQSHLKVTLRLIDDGIVISSVKCNEIFVCDEKFKNFPPQAVDVRLMKVVPFDNERSWDSKTTKQVQKWIIEEIKSTFVIQASINFSLADTIWVNNLVVMEKLSGIDAYCPVVDLKKSLVVKNFAVLFNGDRKHVRDLAEEYGLLNSTKFDIDNDDSDIDYQSCKNDSINLIKFSSSNDEAINSSRESAETGLEQTKKLQNITFDVKDTKKQKISAVVKHASSSHDEQDWDDILDGGRQLNEVYVPIKKEYVDKDTSNLKQKLSTHSNIIASPKQESWSKLPLNELVKVEIGDEGENGNWENIFLQIIDKSSLFLFEELKELIAKHVENIKASQNNQKKIYEFEPLHNCIVKYNNIYLRAKVYGIYGNSEEERLYRFFLCDYACFTNAKIEDLYSDFLYETSAEIVNFTPYQAIHCTLAGIKWDRFTKRYQVTKEYLYACAILESDSEKKNGSNLHNLPIQSYKILLYECENENEFSNALLFNQALVDNGITIYDDETKNFLEYEIGMQENQEHKSTNVANDKVEKKDNVRKAFNTDKVLTCEQLIEYLQSDAFDIEMDNLVTVEKNSDVKSLQDNSKKIENQESLKITEIGKEVHKVVKEKSKVPTSDSEIDEQGHCTSNSNSSKKSSVSLISTDVSNRSDSESQFPTQPPSLKTLHKRPLTTWYQNDTMIFISIHAPDVKDYHLEVSTKTILFSATIQFEKAVLVLNLLASIDTRSVSHELKGLNVIIRLKKNVFVKWPRLLQATTKYFWLKYNFNAFDSIEMEYIMPQQLFHTILDNDFYFDDQKIDNYGSDDDDERELYQTYNPIQGNDDDCDPFS